MQSGWRVGSLFGIPLYIDPSWFFILVLIAIPRGAQWQQAFGWDAATAYSAGITMALLLFASVLLHELGHSLVARSQGIKVNSITLFLFGGVASIDQESKTPGKAFQVAIAGPAVSLGLFVILSGVSLLVPGTSTPLTVLIRNLAVINLVLGLFNLIPGLPLDGGQVLKAAVWKITGDRFKGVHWAARVGTLLGWSAIGVGLWAFLLGDFGGLWIALLGWFGVQNASSYGRMNVLQQALLQIKAADAMTREFRVVDANMTLRQFADEYLLNPDRVSVYYAASDGRYRGLISADALYTIERSQWDSQTLFRIVQPLNEIPTVAENDSLVSVIHLMETRQLRRVTVLSPAGAVSGVIDRGDNVRALAKQLNVPVSETIIQQIKSEGIYPPGLPLSAIAQSVIDSVQLPGRSSQDRGLG